MKKRKIVAGLLVAGCLSQAVAVSAMAAPVSLSSLKEVSEDSSVDTSTLTDSSTTATTTSAVSVTSDCTSSQYKRHTVTISDNTMSYIQLGNKFSDKTVVISHGTAFNAGAMLPYGKLYAKAGYNVILIDMPGHYAGVGHVQSDFEDMTDDVAEMIDTLAKQHVIKNKVEFQGWSLGGTLALNMAIKHPEHLNSIGIIDSTSNYYGLQLPTFTEDTKIAGLTATVTQLKSPAVDQSVTDSLIANFSNTVAPADANNVDVAMDATVNLDSEISKIKVPVYDFFGLSDAVSTLDKQNSMKSTIKKFKLKTETGYNHFAVMENPELVYKDMRSMDK